MQADRKVVYCMGDGIGPEIMEAVLGIMDAAAVPVGWEEIMIGEKVYLAGNTSGIGADAWEKIRRHKVFLKAPITTPQGGGYKSLNVTIRKSLALFANVRPCRSYAPFIETKHPQMDVIIVRENEEDLYAGIEHQQTDDVVQCLKLITRPGCERIIRYAFAMAQQLGRKKITCFSKDNIMKQTDGLFHRVFREVSREYPEIETEHLIVDIGAARLADTPERFDVVVMPNLYGDILSDVAAQISGSVGMAGSANIGEQCAMFEAIHGSAPDIAGKNMANPSGLLQGAIMMLNHIGLGSYAETIQNAWLCVLEKGIHTADVYREGISRQRVSTRGFAEAIIAHLGENPKQLAPVRYQDGLQIHIPPYERRPSKKELLGVDVFVDWDGSDANQLAERLQAIANDTMPLRMITNRGVKVWPQGFEETFCTDHWRCRFESQVPVSPKEIVELLQRALTAGIDVIKTENLYTFNGERAFSLGQGQ